MTNPLRRGLAVDEGEFPEEPAAIIQDSETGLPVIVCRHEATTELTRDRIADILLAQEAEWRHEAAR